MKPAYIRIQNSIRNDIEAKKLLPGDRVASENELAKQFGVNRSTAKRALDDLAQLGVLSKIAGVGTFVSDAPMAAKRSHNNQIQTICFVCPILKEPEPNTYHFEIFQGAEEEAKKHNCRLIMVSVRQDASPAAVIDDLIHRNNADAAIFSTMISPDVPRYGEKKGLPVAVYGYNQMSNDFDCILPDNFIGGFDMTQYLLNSGHRRIAFIYASKDGRYEERLFGYRKAMEDAGIADVQKLTWIDFQIDEAAKRVISDKVTAVFVCDDVGALGVMMALTKNGVQVPQEVSVAGFGNRMQSTVVEPHITTVDYPKYDIGKLLVRAVLDKIEDPELPPRKILVPTKLIVRDSVKTVECSI